ncbi:HAMP domain-containing histidine kinase [Pontibacter sp. 172403-2]|uniref:sensor histidine kinase n=1 Tax=Pontibacter rufus TaxID=2791028 RepID=UPI0018AFD211|nr:HAMP domain-containing sensor histidine kinase [Pontibacter sp. 172403-2]MBF9253273.1 HAMP domain-containing histidine kinase [Pontibacter sp. 172403-2]
MRLQSKLTLFSAASKIIIFLLLVLVLPPLIHKVALHNTDERLLQKKEQVLRIVEEQGIGNFIAEGDNSAYGSYNLLKEEFISLEQVPAGQEVNSIENSLRKVEDEVVDYRVLSLTFQIDDQTYLLEIGRSIATIRESIDILQQYALIFLVVVVVLTAFVDLAFNKILLRPLSLIIRRLQRIGHPGTFQPKQLHTSTKDFIYLNDTINSMMGQVQAAFLKEKEFIGNVSHELLTPISILQNRMENLLADPETPEHLLVKLVDNQRTLHRLKSIVQALLLISRIENEQYLKNEAIDIKTLAEEVAEEIRDRAEAREVELSVAIADDWTLPQGNESLLFTMLFNVVNNAIKYNRPGGKVMIEGRVMDKAYELCIIDTGVGIAAEQLPHIFSRFKRLHAPDGESHGLGLPIVQTIAQFHRIKLTVDSVPGAGTTFCFRFPGA